MFFVPSFGDWVYCRFIHDRPGKVIKVNNKKKKFTALFLVKSSDAGNRGSIEKITLGFEKIKRIATEEKIIKNLNSELDKD